MLSVVNENSPFMPSSILAGLAQRRMQRPRRLPRRREVVGGERQHGGHHAVPVGRAMSSGVHRHRVVGVGADAEPVEALPEVQVGVLVAQDRAGRLGGRAGQRGQLVGPGELVCQRRSAAAPCRPCRATLGPQMPAQHTTIVRRAARPASVSTARDPTVAGTDVEYLAWSASTPAPRPAARRSCAATARTRLGDPVGRHVQRAQDYRRVEQVVVGQRLVAGEHPATHPPRGEPAVPAVQLGQPLRCGRHLQAADLAGSRARRPVLRPLSFSTV